MDRADDKPPLWVCGRLEAIAETRDADGYFGILWGWRDRVGRERQEVFAREMFAGEAGEMSRAMAARGLTFNATREARQAFLEYVNLASASAHARVVARTGWHTIGGTLIYVLPDQIFGNSPIRGNLADHQPGTGFISTRRNPRGLARGDRPTVPGKCPPRPGRLNGLRRTAAASSSGKMGEG
ncbi:MAG: DUF927 domain-containing protein [Rhodospirillales bacterium]